MACKVCLVFLSKTPTSLSLRFMRKAKISWESLFGLSLCYEVLSSSLIVWSTIAATYSAYLITFISYISSALSLSYSQWGGLLYSYKKALFLYRLRLTLLRSLACLTLWIGGISSSIEFECFECSALFWVLFFLTLAYSVNRVYFSSAGSSFSPATTWI